MQSDPLRGTFVDTAFDGAYCSTNTHRQVTVSRPKVLAAAAASPDWDEILMVVNDTTYGGSGGSFSVVSTNVNAVDVARHEFGHTFSRLADEYTSPYPGFPACSDLAGPDACEANVTDQTSRAPSQVGGLGPTHHRPSRRPTLRLSRAWSASSRERDTSPPASIGRSGAAS